MMDVYAYFHAIETIKHSSQATKTHRYSPFKTVHGPLLLTKISSTSIEFKERMNNYIEIILKDMFKQPRHNFYRRLAKISFELWYG